MITEFLNKEEEEIFEERCAMALYEGHVPAKQALEIASQEIIEYRKKFKVSETEKIITLEYLLQKDLPALNWVIPEILCEGVTILASRPKVGKSWFCFQLSLAVATGQFFLNKYVPVKSPVLYIPLEDSERRIKNRFSIIKKSIQVDIVDSISNLSFPTGFTIKPLNDGGLKELEDYISESGFKLIVVDTLSRAIRSQMKRKNILFNEDYELIGKIQKFALEKHVAIILVHHTTKLDYSDNVFDGIQGTTGITAGADTLMVLKNDSNDFVLHIIGKDVIADDIHLSFDKTTCLWSIANNQMQGSTPERTEILNVISNNKNPMGTGEIADKLSKGKSTISTMLKKMVGEGLLKKVEFGKYNTVETIEGIES